LKVWYNYRHILEGILEGILKILRIENRSSGGWLTCMTVPDMSNEVPLDKKLCGTHVALDWAIRVCL
jgi:hypothetical protein